MGLSEIIEKIASFYKYDYNTFVEKRGSTKKTGIKNVMVYFLHYDCGYSCNTIAKSLNISKRRVDFINSVTRYRISYFNEDASLYKEIKEIVMGGTE